jgi:hypothetical protein
MQEVEDVHARWDFSVFFLSVPPSSVITPPDCSGSRVSRFGGAAVSSWIRFTASLRRAAASRAMLASPIRSTWGTRRSSASTSSRSACTTRSLSAIRAPLIHARGILRRARACASLAEPTGLLPRSAESVAQDHTQKRVVDLQAAVVLDESELPKFVHEEVHTRTRRPHHLGERFLRHFRERPM